MSYSDALLRVDGLTKTFGSVMAVDDVGFSISKGETKSIIGPNGAGKTSLFNCLSGIYDLTDGTVWFQGGDISHESPHVVSRRGLGRTFQISNLFSEFTVFENVRLASQIQLGNDFNLWNDHRSLDEPIERADRILETIGLKNKRNAHAQDLAHGELRQLEIGVALATDPDLLLLDEPTAGISTADIPKMQSLIQSLSDDLSILLIEHNIDMVMDVSDTVLVMYNGQKLADDTPEGIRANDEVQDAYLGTEYDFL
jgi:branched-chain amino acid transport system ATP-binding protein